MKYFIWITFFLFGCSSTVQSIEKPSGEQALEVLFGILDRDLSAEPLCDMASISSPRRPYTLKHHISVILATSYESDNKTTIDTQCEASQFEQRANQIIDIWDCRLTTNELTSNGEFISASTIAFGVDKSSMEYIPKSLRCF